VLEKNNPQQMTLNEKEQKNIDKNDFNMYKMYADDIAHNVSALCVFNTTLDAEVLHDNIMRQDTCPREHFYTVLKYIEDNALINANAFCCN
jgi:hypothetical protein